MDNSPYWVILLMYRSHDMRSTGFRRLTVINGTPGFWDVTNLLMLIVLYYCLCVKFNLLMKVHHNTNLGLAK